MCISDHKNNDTVCIIVIIMEATTEEQELDADENKAQADYATLVKDAVLFVTSPGISARRARQFWKKCMKVKEGAGDLRKVEESQPHRRRSPSKSKTAVSEDTAASIEAARTAIEEKSHTCLGIILESIVYKCHKSKYSYVSLVHAYDIIHIYIYIYYVLCL